MSVAGFLLSRNRLYKSSSLVCLVWDRVSNVGQEQGKSLEESAEHTHQIFWRVHPRGAIVIQVNHHCEFSAKAKVFFFLPAGDFCFLRSNISAKIQLS